MHNSVPLLTVCYPDPVLRLTSYILLLLAFLLPTPTWASRHAEAGHNYILGENVAATVSCELHHNYKRYYSPETGRYLGVDPARADATGYSYAKNSPLSYVDPGGDIPFLVAAALIIQGTSLAYSAYDLATYINEQYNEVLAGNICENQAITNVFAKLGIDLAISAVGLGAGKILKGIYRFAKNSKNTSRVFWSGGSAAREAAEKYAQKTGAVTLEQTLAGKTLDIAGKVVPYKVLRPYWEKASAKFASGADDFVSVVINPSEYRGAKSVFETSELPILDSNNIDVLFTWLP